MTFDKERWLHNPIKPRAAAPGWLAVYSLLAVLSTARQP